jgi:hypothetical protein
MVIHGQNATKIFQGKLHLAMRCDQPNCESLLLLPMDWVGRQLYFDWLGEIEK